MSTFRRRGPMPTSMRLGVLALFGGVFLTMAVSMCFGVSQLGTTAGPALVELIPTEEDARIAQELRARGAAGGKELEVTAVEIAHARRLGQLDAVMEASDAILPAAPSTGSRADPVREKHHVKGAFYRDEQVAAEPIGFPWGWAAVAFGAMIACLAAVAAAFLASREAADPASEESPVA